MLVNPEQNSRKYWRESLEDYLASQGVEAEIIEEGTMSLLESNVMNALRRLNTLVKEGKRPALLITDIVLNGDDQGSEIVGSIRRNHAVENQRIVWPEGQMLPAVILSGGLEGIYSGPAHPNTFTGSCICLHDELNDPHYRGPGRPAIDEFKNFVNKALGLPPPKITIPPPVSKPKRPAKTWGEEEEARWLPPEWQGPNRGG